MDDNHDWLDDLTRVASIAVSLLFASILVKQAFGFNVWTWLAEQARLYREQARELAIIRRMWANG